MKKLFTGVAALAVGLGLAACADSRVPLAPAAPAASRGPARPAAEVPAAASRAAAAQWRTPLAQTASASALIGPAGGVLTLPQTGLRLVVPAGAVLVPTQFGVTARAGKVVAYDFQPAGARFLAPLVLEQDPTLVVTPSGPPGLTPMMQLGYFQSEAAIDDASATAIVSELQNVLAGLAIGPRRGFPVFHFSGYIVCWGRGNS